jgi:hypothetical protein
VSEDQERPTLDNWPCGTCGRPVPAELAYADMETLTLLCPECIRAKLGPCEVCGAKIRAAAYQHLPTGRVICEPCVVKMGATN